ncbi:MAG TPA: cobyric acid synthase [Acidimicrobiia bacterium]|nr:cobyric acid synthase [Acidimicrobiia bacterium]
MTGAAPGGTGLRGALMVCGTTSDAGKTTLVMGLARLLARQGARVAPFKAQNMALNSAVTESGHEIARAQALQAAAAGVEPDVAMNPVLLKPTGERTAQVVVGGRPVGVMSAADYDRGKSRLFGTVLDALADLRSRFDVVLLEGAGSPAEINLLARDIANLRVARAARVPALVVGDIDRGGVFAGLYGTVALLPDDQRAQVRGFVINKLRGDPSLLGDACADLEARTGVPTLGVVPWTPMPPLDAEDSVGLATRPRSTAPPVADALDVAVLALPRISNFTDLDPLWIEPGVRVRFVEDPAGWGRPDLVVVPGTKATVDDLAWLRACGLAHVLTRTGAAVLGICGGYQLLGRGLEDRVESGAGTVAGLGLLPVDTRFEPEKVTRRRTGTALGCAVAGYQIHHGRVRAHGGDPFVCLDDGAGPVVDGVRQGTCFGTTLHGLLDADSFRARFLGQVAARAGKRFVAAGVSFEGERQARIDGFADVLAEHLDVAAVERLIGEA